MDNDLESNYEKYDDSENTRRIEAIGDSINGSLLNDNDINNKPIKYTFIIVVGISISITIGVVIFLATKY